MKSLVDDDLVREASLFKRRFLFFRLDVIPFFIYYVLALWLAVSDNYKVYGLILAPIGFVAHMILFLFTRWSVKLNCLVANTPCTSIDTADLVCVTAAPNAGSSKILPIYKVRYELTNKPINVVGIEFRPSRFLFQFQQVNYYHDCQQKDFRRLQYPTNTTVQSFLSWRGYQDLESVAIATLIWGYNAFDIPMPSFLDLYIVSMKMIILIVSYTLLTF